MNTHLSAAPADTQVTAPTGQSVTVPTLLWQSEYIEESNDFESLTNRGLAIDPTGNIHMAYGGMHLTYAWYDGSTWHYETVSEAEASYVALALEPVLPYRPYISYMTDASLHVAHRTASGWVIEVVDSEPTLTLGYYTSIALEPVAPYTPHVSYRDVSYGTLKHAWRTSSGWQTEVVDPDDAFFTSIAIAPVAPYTLHVSYAAYFAPHELRHAWWTPAAGWTIETVDTHINAGEYSSIAVEPVPPYAPRISYYGGYYESAYSPTFAWKTGDTWETEVIQHDAGSYTSLVIVPVPPYTPTVAIFDWNQIHLAERTPAGLWRIDSFPAHWTTAMVSLALWPTAPYTPHISYYVGGVDGSECIRDMVHAWRVDSGWSTEVVDDGIEVGDSPALVIAPTAPYTPYVAYGRSCAVDTSRNGLVYGWRTPAGQWISETVDSNGQVGSWHGADLVIASTLPYTPYIAYEMSDVYGESQLRYAKRSGTSWITEVVTTTIGRGPSVVLEPLPPFTPHIVFWDANFSRLYHSWLSDTVWVSEATLSEAVNDYGLGIAPTTPFTLQMAYAPHDRSALDYAWRTDGGWVTESVTAPLMLPMDMALAPTAPYTPYISYGQGMCYPGGACGLWWARRVDGNWLTGPVQRADGNSFPLSWATVAAVEPFPPYNPRFAYCWEDDNLNYAWLVGDSWRHTTLRTGACQDIAQAITADSPYEAHIVYSGDGLVHLWQMQPSNFVYLPLALRSAE